MLVSVGLDSKVVIWSGYTFEKLRTISHQSHVKGVTFDPANKYFATASDDRTMKIIRYTPPGPASSAHDQAGNFVVETTISAPFGSSPLTTYFRRCSWSPDGAFVAGANAVNGPLSSVVVIFRGTWVSDIHLIGHEGPVEVCAFSPRLYDLGKPESAGKAGMKVPMTMCACAGQDKSLSVWATGHPRPLVVTFDLTLKSISDLAWHPNGQHLFITGLDGSIITVTFRSSEIGDVCELEENERSISKFGTSRRGAGLVEGAAGLILEERSRAGERDEVEGRMGELMGEAGSGTQQDGLRPMVNGGTVPAKQGAINDISNMAVAGPDGEVRTNGHVQSEDKPEQERQHQEAQKQQEQAMKIEKLKQRVTITKDGKKRITPLLVSGSASTIRTSIPKPQPVTTSSNNPASKEASRPRIDLSNPYEKLPKGGLAALLVGNKRRLAMPEGRDEGYVERRIAQASADGAVPILVSGVDGLAPPAVSSEEPQLDWTPDFLRPAVVDPTISVSQVRLAVPKVRSQISYILDSTADSLGRIGQNSDVATNNSVASRSRATLEVRNPAYTPGRTLDRAPTRITVTKGGQLLWQDYLARSVLLVTANQNFWAAACEDGSIYVWTPAGRRSLNAIVVESQPVIFESLGWWLLCVTSVGLCHVWNLKSVSSAHPPVSLAPILNIATLVLKNSTPHMQQGPAVTSARLNSQGHIIVTLTNGDGYMYNPSLMAWQRLSEAWWAVGSQYWNSTDPSIASLQQSRAQAAESGPTADDDPANVSTGIIPYVERRTNKEVLVRQRGFQLQKLIRSLFAREGFAGLESSISIAHLEDRIAAALQLGSRQDFRINLFMYAKRIGAEGLQAKVEELLKALIGALFEDVDEPANGTTAGQSSNKGRIWDGDSEQLCGWNRRELLKGVVFILGKLHLLCTYSSTDG